MAELILFSVVGVALGICSERLFYSIKSRYAAAKDKAEFKKEVIESWSYMEDPSGMDKDLSDLLNQENLKNQQKSIDSHPAKNVNLEYSHLSGYLEDRAKKTDKKNKRNKASEVDEIYLKFWK